MVSSSMKPVSKRDNFARAVQRLHEAAEAYARFGDDVMRDGVIQRFEFTFELSWKALKEYMQSQGSTAELQFPKQVLREAYAAGLIDGESTWLSMLADRNTTSHIYDDKLAGRICRDICGAYLPVLEALTARMQSSPRPAL